MSAILGTFNFDLWRGNAPPAVKTTVELIYRPGQSTAAARLFPNQSTQDEFVGVVYGGWSGANALADSYRSIIGTVVSLTYLGEDYGDVLVKDVTVQEIKKLGICAGIHPDGTSFSESPGARVTSRWTLVRLS